MRSYSTTHGINHSMAEVINSATVHGKYVYSTLALEKEREIVKEETALRKEKEAQYAVMLYKDTVHIHVHTCTYH